MILNNYYPLLSRNVHGGAKQLVDMNGSKQWPVAGTVHKLETLMGTVKTASTGYGVVLGTGNTPVTFNDYKLSGSQITSFSYTKNVTTGFVNSAQDIYVRGDYVITNTSSTAFTIKEVGVVALHSSSSNQTTLIERTVLTEPVTIEPGGVGKITYQIDLYYPTA